MESVRRIELPLPAWRAEVLPLNYTDMVRQGGIYTPQTLVLTHIRLPHHNYYLNNESTYSSKYLNICASPR